MSCDTDKGVGFPVAVIGVSSFVAVDNVDPLTSVGLVACWKQRKQSDLL